MTSLDRSYSLRWASAAGTADAAPAASAACASAAARADAARRAEIEHAADEVFLQHFGEYPWDVAAEHPQLAAALPVRTLDAVTDAGGILGFTTLIDVADFVHLEQLSVHPEHGRRGIGRALIAHAIADARGRGVRAVTLRTFAEVPWNGPFYERLGFRTTATAPTPFHAGLEEVERGIGLLDHGPRVHMRYDL